MQKWLILAVLLSCAVAIDLDEYMEDQQRDPEALFKPYTPNLQKQTALQTLIFYTPWNKQGKDLVRKYATKFDYVSPCWYEVNVRDKAIVLDHEINYDLEFIRDVKKRNPGLKILPRLYIPGAQSSVMQALASSQQSLQQLRLMVRKISKMEGIDGFVWDTPYSVFSKESKYKGINEVSKQVINMLKEVLKPEQELFVNTDRPSSNSDLELIRSLNIDGLLIQNYASRENPEEIQQSLDFVKQLDQPSKKYVILLPFFSRKNMQSMISSEQAKTTIENKGLRSCRLDRMCIFDCDRSNTFDMPCYNYFRDSFTQLLASNNPNMMVGFWQAGNGLEIYYSFI